MAHNSLWMRGTGTLTLLALLLAPVGALGDNGNDPPSNLCHTITLAKGEHSDYGMASPDFAGADLIIRDPLAWKAFWHAHTANLDPQPPLPPVDFRRHMVLASILGAQSSGGGPNIAILGVERDGPFVRVKVFDDERPGPLDVVTNPFHIVLLAKDCVPPDASVVFHHMRPQPRSGVVIGSVMSSDATTPQPIPLPGAKVSLISPTGTNPALTLSGLDGSFFFVNVPPGPYVLRAEAIGFQAEEVTIQVDADMLVGHMFVLTPAPPDPGKVFGHVYAGNDPSSFQPVAGAKVKLVSDGGVVDEMITGNDGYYQFLDVAPGSYGLHVEHPDYAPAGARIYVAPGATVEWDFHLVPAQGNVGTFAGLVLGLTTDPVPVPIDGATVQLLDANGNVVAEVQTTPLGTFIMRDVPSGHYVGRAFKRPDWAPDEAPIAIVPNDITHHVFELSPAPNPGAYQTLAH